MYMKQQQLNLFRTRVGLGVFDLKSEDLLNPFDLSQPWHIMGWSWQAATGGGTACPIDCGIPCGIGCGIGAMPAYGILGC